MTYKFYVDLLMDTGNVIDTSIEASNYREAQAKILSLGIEMVLEKLSYQLVDTDDTKVRKELGKSNLVIY